MQDLWGTKRFRMGVWFNRGWIWQKYGKEGGEEVAEGGKEGGREGGREGRPIVCVVCGLRENIWDTCFI